MVEAPGAFRRAPPLRKTSSPFLRKPVPRGEEEDSHNPTPPPVRNPPLRRRLSYSSISHDATSSHPDLTVDMSDGSSSSSSANDNDNNHKKRPTLERHLSLFDLVAIGVGGTIGSGLFVLAGLVAHKYAGPATVVSWCMSGLAACLSGCCYAELSGRIPLPGSAYAYTYVAMGEVFAVVAAACLSLEYICAAAAVSRSWGDKMVEWLSESLPQAHGLHAVLAAEASWNPLAFCIAAACVTLLLRGVKESKKVTNFFTTLKIALVVFMVVMALYYTKPSNWVPFAPFGVSGVVRGGRCSGNRFVAEVGSS
jgi:APA family basic amino acid/polyamine antiporter